MELVKGQSSAYDVHNMQDRNYRVSILDKSKDFGLFL